MPQLANIFPAAGNAASAEDENPVRPNAGHAGAEPFDDVMSRALSPPEANVAAAQNRRQRTSFAGAQKRNPVVSTPPPAPVKAGEDSPADSADPLATVKTKAGAKGDDPHCKSADSLAQTGAGVITDALPNPEIPQPAQPFSAWSLNSSSAAAESAANNPVATVVLPLGVVEKTGAALKLDLQTGGLSAAVPELSVLAGTEAGASAQKKMEAVPPDASQPDSSIVLKNPAAESAANSPVAAAVTPFGKAGKIGAAQKLDSQTGGLSAAGAELSVLAGTEAGEAAQKNIEAVPTDGARLDDSIVLQNPAAESAAQAPVKSHGTPVARQDVPMKKAEQTNKVAGQAEKVLPGSAVSAAPEKVLPVRGLSVPAPVRSERLEANAANLAVVPERAAGGALPPDEAVAVSNVSDRGAQALDRTHELVSLHALRLVDAKADLLQVVLKPGAGTQLSLELRQRGGSIEAQAVLQSGDFAHLKQHWPELQQRLELRGIKLAPLAGEGNFAAGSGSQGFQNQRNQPAEREPLFAGTVAGFGLARGMVALADEPAVRTAASGGWQMWA